MKLEKRSGGQPSEAPEEAPGKKPVLVYIMILFIAAFLLMALSFAAHQRRNTEALGELQNSVSAMQEVQANQDQIIHLQKELAETRKELEALKDDAVEMQNRLESAQKESEALQALYRLQQHYSNQDFAACASDIALFEAQGYLEALPEKTGEDVTKPAERFQQLKAAVESAAAEN